MPRVKRLHNYHYKPVHQPKPRVSDPEELQVISGGGCWCGKPYKHDWEGRDEGAPHPR